MKLMSYEAHGINAWGVVKGAGVVDLSDLYPSLADAIEGDMQRLSSAVEERAPTHQLANVTFLPPISAPGKIFCVGVNYRNRNAEYKDGSDEPPYPSLFMRTPGSLTGHRAPILRPPESEQFDYEGEIVMVIGKAGRRIKSESSASHVFGLTMMNEGSIRDWLRHGKFNVTQGKNFEKSGSIGPWIVTSDEAGAFDRLTVTTHVNGDERQNGSTSDLMFPFARIIEYISTFSELLPGDIIATGTPPGAGARFDPPKYLKPGDVVEVSSPQIGTLRNKVQDEGA
jgi:2-keto-4-pentenoate hydratase/2-oxohepta-3-ene-1,7-dioic acid hydratase in catechol pathway